MTIRELLLAILGLWAGVFVVAVSYLFNERRSLKKELDDARFWIGWHKGWAAGWESCRQPKEAEPRSCGECKHAKCSMDEEPCKTCISTLKIKHVTRSKFEAIKEEWNK